MPILAFHPASAHGIKSAERPRCTAVEITPLAAEVLQKMVAETGGLLDRQHLPVLQRLAQSQPRDGDLLLLSALLETHDAVFVRLL
jgi:hypothetical protein